MHIECEVAFRRKGGAKHVFGKKLNLLQTYSPFFPYLSHMVLPNLFLLPHPWQ